MNAADFIAAVRDATYPRLPSLRPDCPPALTSAIEQCLQYDAAQRPPSAASLEAQLEHAVRGTRVDLSAYAAGLFPGGAPLSRSQAHTTPMRAEATTATVNTRLRPPG